jgi:hypothetical protein
MAAVVLFYDSAITKTVRVAALLRAHHHNKPTNQQNARTHGWQRVLLESDLLE